MRNLLLSLLLLSISLKAMADGEYPYLTFESSDGSVVSIAVLKQVESGQTESGSIESLSLELTVEDGTLVAKNDEGKTIFTLTDLTKMYFSESDVTKESTGIQTIEGESSSQPIELYTTTGISLGQYKNLEAAKSKMVPGIYIVKSGRQQIKISIK